MITFCLCSLVSLISYSNYLQNALYSFSLLISCYNIFANHIDAQRNVVSFDRKLSSSYSVKAKCCSKFLVNKNCHVACANLCTFCSQIACDRHRNYQPFSLSLSLSTFLPSLRSNKCAKISILTFQF